MYTRGQLLTIYELNRIIEEDRAPFLISNTGGYGGFREALQILFMTFSSLNRSKKHAKIVPELPVTPRVAETVVTVRRDIF